MSGNITMGKSCNEIEFWVRLSGNRNMGESVIK